MSIQEQSTNSGSEIRLRRISSTDLRPREARSETTLSRAAGNHSHNFAEGKVMSTLSQLRRSRSCETTLE